jgi:predicted RNA-binding Zn ribbon-like protein
VDAFNRELERSLRRQQVHLHGKELHMGWDLSGEELDGFLAPVVASAASLLTSDSLDLVKVCGGDTCGWMFVDRSKNHSRRWCTMKDCGNVAKVRRFRGRAPGQEGKS